MDRFDIFYFTRSPLTEELVRAAAQHAGGVMSYDSADRVFGIEFGPDDEDSTVWYRFDPSVPGDMGSVDREELLVLLERGVQYGIFGAKIRAPAQADVGRFLAALLRCCGGFVGFNTDRWEPIFTAASADDLEDLLHDSAA